MFEFIKKLFEPHFKVGDKVYYIDTDFPDKSEYKKIIGVGKREYQYVNYFDGGTSGIKHTSTIAYMDRNYRLLNEGE